MKNNIIFKFILISISLTTIITLLYLYNLKNVTINWSIKKAHIISSTIQNSFDLSSANKIEQYHQLIQSLTNLPSIHHISLSENLLYSNQNKQFNTDLERQAVQTQTTQYSIVDILDIKLIKISLPYNHVVNNQTIKGSLYLEVNIDEIIQEGITTLYSIIITFIVTLIIAIFLIQRILDPYNRLLKTMHNSLILSTSGQFKTIEINETLSIQEKTLIQNYNKVMSIFNTTSKDIEKKLKRFIGHKSNNNEHNRLNESKEIISNLSNLYQFKKEIELDASKEEIYQRIIQIFKNQFGIRNFTLVEIDTDKNKQTIIGQVGTMFYCEKIIKESPQSCRAARTKHDVMSVDYHSSCPYFKEENRFYYCTSMEIISNVQLVINFVFETKEELDKLKNNISFIKNYINEAIPSIEVKLLMDALKESAFKDSLTGLYNRKFLDEHTQKLIPYAKRENISIGVLMLDMDHFKSVNDEYGHDIGDKVLKELSRILEESVRESDIVIRYGGEEFIVLLIGINTVDDALFVANKIREKVKENEITVYAGTKLKKTVSIGLSVFPKDSTALESVIKNADIALYEAKSSGRDKVVRFNEEQISSVDLF